MTGMSVRPYWEPRFDAYGDVDLRQRDRLLEQAAQRDLTDLVVFAHGWNNTRTMATRLYDRFFAPFPELLGEAGPARLGYMGVVWPSMRFADESLAGSPRSRRPVRPRTSTRTSSARGSTRRPTGRWRWSSRGGGRSWRGWPSCWPSGPNGWRRWMSSGCWCAGWSGSGGVRHGRGHSGGGRRRGQPAYRRCSGRTCRRSASGSPPRSPRRAASPMPRTAPFPTAGSAGCGTGRTSCSARRRTT